MMIMSEERSPTPNEQEPPAGAMLGALERTPHRRDLRHDIERRIEASALASSHRTRADRLTFTAIVVGTFALLTWVLDTLAGAGPGPLSPLLLAIGLATWYGGVGQGLLATAASLTIAYFLMDPL
jgi:hypothetical protein